MTQDIHEHWQLIDSIFAQALELPPEERARFLDQTCTGEPDIRREVEALIQLHEEAEDLQFLEDPVIKFEVPLMPGLNSAGEGNAGAPADGQRIGAYRLIKEIGQGGMGCVYLAERVDGQYRQRVALKLLRQGMTSQEILRRFRLERQILARLQHPNIALLLDGGVTEGRLPYFVMQYVDGEPIDHYCDQKRLSIKDRLRLFVTVCEAVQYAHQNLVVHRDLKPSNILVTETGQVKLLDFGIAKVLDAALMEGATAFETQTGRRLMTPAYASPEQVRGEAITVASDVYALGVLLYKLLAGRLPHVINGSSPSEVERMISEEEPEKPSVVVRDASAEVSAGRSTRGEALRRQLAGDLDKIVMKALRKEVLHRYGSVEQLAADVRRYLAGLPVEARRPTWSYRVGKFVRRHRVGIAATVVFVLFGVLYVAYAVQVASERDRANLEAVRALATREFVVEIFTPMNPNVKPEMSSPRTFMVSELIEAGLAKIDALSDPLDQAAVLDFMGQVCIAFGLFNRADSLFSRALEMKIDDLGRMHPDVVESLYGLGRVARYQAEYDEAVRHYRQALYILEETSRMNSHQSLEIQNNLAWIFYQQRNFKEAEQWYHNALAIGRRLEEENLDEQDIRLEIAESLSGLATLSRGARRLDEAEQLFREALEILNMELGDSRPLTADALYKLGDVLKGKGDLTSAEAFHERALNIYLATHGDQHRTVANSYRTLGMVNHRMGNFIEAEDYFRRSINIYEKAVGPKALEKANPLWRLGQLLIEQGDAARAEPLLRETLEIYQVNSLPSTNFRVASINYRLGICLKNLGRYEEAEQYLLQSYHSLKNQSSTQGWTQSTLTHLIDLYEAWGKPEKAAEYRALLPKTAEEAQTGIP